MALINTTVSSVYFDSSESIKWYYLNYFLQQKAEISSKLCKFMYQVRLKMRDILKNGRQNNINPVCPQNITNIKFIIIHKKVNNKYLKFIPLAPGDSDTYLVIVGCCHYWPISYHWLLAITTENITKLKVFLYFQGSQKENTGMKWVKQR